MMEINNEKNVMKAVCKLADHYTFNNLQDVTKILAKAKSNAVFRQTKVGTAFIQRLMELSSGGASSDCIYCGNSARNRVICDDCRANDGASVIDKLLNNIPFGRQTVNAKPSIDIDDFRELEDSIGRAASKSSIKEIKKLTFINIALGIVNLVCMFFLALFLWKFIMAQA